VARLLACRVSASAASPLVAAFLRIKSKGLGTVNTFSDEALSLQPCKSKTAP
jgi:hypothetical protein